MKYFKVIIFLIVLTSVIMVPWVTGEETQTAPIMTDVIESEDTISEKPEVNLPPQTEQETIDKFPSSITVLNVSETTTVNIREQPSSDSGSLGVVYGDLVHVEVIKHLDNGYSEVATRDYISTQPISGFVPTKYIKEVKLDEEYGVIVDINQQKVDIYKDNDLIKTLICSTGVDDNQNFTPTGLYRIGERGDSFYSPTQTRGLLLGKI